MVLLMHKMQKFDSNGNLIECEYPIPPSSEGPTDDYRIKPDITGNGTGVLLNL